MKNLKILKFFKILSLSVILGSSIFSYCLSGGNTNNIVKKNLETLIQQKQSDINTKWEDTQTFWRTICKMPATCSFTLVNLIVACKSTYLYINGSNDFIFFPFGAHYLIGCITTACIDYFIGNTVGDVAVLFRYLIKNITQTIFPSQFFRPILISMLSKWSTVPKDTRTKYKIIEKLHEEFLKTGTINTSEVDAKAIIAGIVNL